MPSPRAPGCGGRWQGLHRLCVLLWQHQGQRALGPDGATSPGRHHLLSWGRRCCNLPQRPALSSLRLGHRWCEDRLEIVRGAQERGSSPGATRPEYAAAHPSPRLPGPRAAHPWPGGHLSQRHGLVRRGWPKPIFYVPSKTRTAEGSGQLVTERIRDTRGRRCWPQ